MNLNRLKRGLSRGAIATAGATLVGIIGFGNFSGRSEDNGLANSQRYESEISAESNDAGASFDRNANVGNIDGKNNFSINTSRTNFTSYTGKFEGRRNHVYNARPNGKYEPTIGIGHFLNRGDSRETFALVLPEVDYESVYSGRADLNDSQVDKLFTSDLKVYITRAKKLVPALETMPMYVQESLVDMAYRGDLGDSPKTIKLLNAGEFRKAGDEYIDRREYQDVEKNGMSGLRTRMDSNRERLIRYAQELSDSKQ